MSLRTDCVYGTEKDIANMQLKGKE